ncbi:MAG: pre-peptidase C-terminal domain-containing protein, partial [Planctomycetaceae bacterium]|nr:pre-peptidase C-terminal domain-containing protein [Planctomycetaceae bacterium]
MIKNVLKLVRNFLRSELDSKAGKIERRKLQIETLESRELLSASPFDSYQDELGELYSPVICAPPTNVDSELSSVAAVNGQVSQAPPVPLNETFTLHSNPDSNFTIYLDFNGHVTTGTYWNDDYGNIVTPAFSFDNDPNFSNEELEMIQYIWQRVAEDFIPFNVDVTTEEPPLDHLTKDTDTSDSDGHWGIRVAIGGTSYDWLGEGAGGIAYLSSFSWNTDTPCFVFSDTQYNDEKNIAEAISHEVGHTLGLSHDGYNLDEYYTEANGWAPIMGAGYYSDVVQWSKGEYNGNTNTEDDLAIITGEITNEFTEYYGGNGFTYRQDDHGGSFQLATNVLTNENSFSVTGIIERNTDLDYFMFDLSTAAVLNLQITSGMRDANLDILARIYDSGGNILYTFDDPETLHANFADLSLAAGVYYLSIDGTSRSFVSDTMIAYTDYGSIGSYVIDFNITRESDPLDSPTLTVTGVTTTTVSLDWTEVNGATGYWLQWSTDANVWDTTTQVEFDANETEYTVEELESNTLYYFRVRAISDNANSEWITVQATTEQEILEDDDYEDNDSFDIVDGVALDSEADHTSKLGVIEMEKIIENLKLVDGNDYFKFEITQNGTVDSYVRVAFENSVGDIDVQLFDGNRKFLRSSSTTSDREKISLENLAAGEYYVRIFAYRDSTNTNYSLTIVPPTTGQDNDPPNTPESFSATQTDEGQVTLTWDAVTDATSYNVYQLIDGEWNVITSVASPTTSYL